MSYKRPKKYARPGKPLGLSRRQVYGLATVAIVVVSLIGIYAFFTQVNGSGFKAAIVDQLSSRQDYVNASFVQTANATLTAAGYSVTYYNGSDVTVDFYRTLPLQGYKLIILRVHAALLNGTEAPLDLFTSEPYSPTKYIYDQSRSYLDVAMYQAGGDKFFGIKPLFISAAMQGRFDDTAIIMMGCNGLDYPGYRSKTTLDAFMHKGAKVIIGWDNAVGVDHTDLATNILLRQLLVKNQTVAEAVNATKAEVGPDPIYKGALTYYPWGNLTVGSYSIPHSSPLKTASLTDAFAFFPLGGIMVSVLPLPSASKKYRALSQLRTRTF